MKRAFVSVLLTVAGASAQCADWLELASTSEMVWEGRVGSREFSATRGGKRIVVAAGRTTDKNTKQMNFEKWYVEVEDCKRGHGNLVTLRMDGTFSFENQFVLKGGSVASGLAEMLCWLVFETDKKGI